MANYETVSPVEILRDYDREMTVKTRAMLADEIERLNGKFAVATWQLANAESLLKGFLEDCACQCAIELRRDTRKFLASAASTVSEVQK